MTRTTKGLEFSLDNYYHHTALNAAIKHRNDLIFEYENQFDTLNGIEYSDMPHNPTPQDGVLNTICRIDETTKRLKERIGKVQERINAIMVEEEKIEDVLPCLEPDEYNVIAMRYGQAKIMGFDEIGSKLRKTVSGDRAQRIHSRAMDNIFAMLNAP